MPLLEFLPLVMVLHFFRLFFPITIACKGIKNCLEYPGQPTLLTFARNDRLIENARGTVAMFSQIALWECFGGVITSVNGCCKVAQGNGLKFVPKKLSHSAIRQPLTTSKQLIIFCTLLNPIIVGRKEQCTAGTVVDETGERSIFICMSRNLKL